VGCKDQDSIQADISLIEEMLSNHFPGVLYAALLQAWSLLLTIMPVQYIKSQTLSKHGKRLVALLDSNEVEVRLASGETLALLFDILRESAEDQEEVFHVELLPPSLSLNHCLVVVANRSSISMIITNI